MEVVVRPIDAVTARPVREAVLRPGRPPEECVYAGDDDPRSLHLGAFAGDALVSVASVSPEAQPGSDEPDAWRIRGMATLEGYRGRGWGRLLLRGLIEHAAAMGGRTIWCNGREGAIPFYLREGFEATTGPFDIEGAGTHRRLVRPLTPDDLSPRGS